MTRPARSRVALATGAALLVAATALMPPAPDLPRLGTDRFNAADHPTAVLAWAKINCFGGLELASNAPRTQMEIILQVAAAYDADSRRYNITSTCSDALAAAKRVIAKDSAPAVTGERPLYEKAVSERTGTIITR